MFKCVLINTLYLVNRDGKSLQNSTGRTLSLKKFAYKICAKNAQNCAKMPNIAQKTAKNIEKPLGKKNCTDVKN